MLSAGQAALDRAAGAKNLRVTLEDRRRDLNFRETRLEEARLADRSWREAWQAACAACWLGERGRASTTAVVRETLEALAALGSALERKGELADRIAKMQRDQTHFEAELEALAGAIGLARGRSDVLALCEEVVNSVASATKALERRQELEERLGIEQDTHHRHLSEIAKVVEPSVKIHVLKTESLRGWAVSVLREAGAIRECEEHGWMQDLGDPHARERALDTARREPPVGFSDGAAVALVGEVLEDFGDMCPECSRASR